MRLMQGKPVFAPPAAGSPELKALPPALSAPSGSLNYYNYNYVTPVRDQGNCGSCWAFATAAALESQVLIGTGASPSQVNLAEQAMVSCAGYSVGDCNGGYIDRASDFIKSTGLPIESCFPYASRNTPCTTAACSNWRTDTYSISGWHWAANGNPTVDNLKNQLYTYGPIVVSMDVYGDFYSYRSGVYSQTTGTYQGGHAVLLVGYDDSTQSFSVKNSWGASWGESGFFRIAYSQLSSVVHFADEAIAYEGYRHLSPGTPNTVSSTAYLAGDFGTNGLWGLHNGTWTKLSTASPDRWATWGQKLVVSFSGAGVYEWDGSSFYMISSNGNVSNMAAGDKVYISFSGGGGLWQWSSGWTLISYASPSIMAASGSRLFVYVASSGIWQWDGATWTLLSTLYTQPVSMAASGSTLYVNMGSSGFWRWDGSSWTELAWGSAQNMSVSGTRVYADFSPYGVWQWDGAQWTLLTYNSPSTMYASGYYLYAGYGAQGLWWWNGSSWTEITASSTTDLTMSGSTFCANFGASGVWQWSNGVWSQISSMNARKIIAVGN